jgi:hypothetical protein
MQLSAAIGINRILVLTHMIDIPLVTKTSDTAEDDDIKINHRQVMTNRMRKEKLIILFQKHLLCNAAHISSNIREHFYMNETFSQMK